MIYTTKKKSPDTTPRLRFASAVVVQILSAFMRRSFMSPTSDNRNKKKSLDTTPRLRAMLGVDVMQIFTRLQYNKNPSLGCARYVTNEQSLQTQSARMLLFWMKDNPFGRMPSHTKKGRFGSPLPGLVHCFPTNGVFKTTFEQKLSTTSHAQMQSMRWFICLR
jgi:hypothetical protein